uniref:Uncharacterized protein n=1 Tax=Anguilla anguilla TaxID=7936 RepID=A0A0E9X6L8_ANGAN
MLFSLLYSCQNDAVSRLTKNKLLPFHTCKQLTETLKATSCLKGDCLREQSSLFFLWHSAHSPHPYTNVCVSALSCYSTLLVSQLY